MKSKRKKFVPFLERLTPEQLAEFRRGMAALRRKFQRRMKRRHNASVTVGGTPYPARDVGGADQQNSGKP